MSINRLIQELRHINENERDRLIRDVQAVMAGDGLMADRMQAEMGQPPVTPAWFYRACNELSKKGLTYKTVGKWLRSKL